MNGNRDFDTLAGQIETVSAFLKEDAQAVINRSVTARAWLTGCYIVEYEQHGQDRAKYGEGLLKALSARLDDDGFSVQNLKNYRKFYQIFPEVAMPLMDYLREKTGTGKGQSTTILLDAGGNLRRQKGQLATVFSAADGIVVPKGESVAISPFQLFNRLSFTHIVELLRLPDALQRTFYAFEAIRGTWSVKELKRQIASRYYARSGWSKSPEKLAALTLDKADKATLRESLRSPHVFEFLGLAAKDVWEENDLEQGVIDHLQAFILEMGMGFCFEARQKKILIDDEYHRIDLVFYHRILKCHVLVELKAKKFGYEDAAQLGVYMAYYRKHVCRADDNPPIGILLCTEVGNEMAEYVSTFVDPSLFLSKYEVELPPKERIEAFLKSENGTGTQRQETQR